MNSPSRWDRETLRNEILKTAHLLVGLLEVVHIRALNVKRRNAAPSPVTAGSFNNAEKLADAVLDLTLDGEATAVFVVLNRADPDLFYRSPNTYQHFAKSTVKSEDIILLTLLLFDCDPVRKSGISSTDAEHEAALATAQRIAEHLTSLGWPEPIFADSGNGGHLLYCIKLPPNDDSLQLIRNVLRHVHERFSTMAGDNVENPVTVDVSVSGAAQSGKLYGSIARKGGDTPERPHRMSNLFFVPSQLYFVTEEQLRLVAAKASVEEPVDVQAVSSPSGVPSSAGVGDGFQAVASPATASPRLIVPQYVKDGGGTHLGHRLDLNGRHIDKVVCPFDSEHNQGEAAITQEVSGKLGFKCHHNSCADRHWQDVKKVLGIPQPHHFQRPDVSSATSDGRWETDTSASTIPAYERTEIEIAKRFRDKFGKEFRYCHNWKKWLTWTGRRWAVDVDGAAMRAAKALAEEVMNLAKATHDTGLIRFAATAARRERLKAMLELAAADLPIRVEDMDRDRYAFNCLNGTLDLRTMVLRQHAREDFITQLCPVSFDPKAKAPLWEKFLADVFDELGVVSFAQRWFGYCLTGVVDEQVLPIFHGSGANGKSTLCNTILNVMGPDYCMQGEPDMLVEGKVRSHSTDRMDLHQMRLVVTSETERGATLAASLVKVLTGGERIRGRRMREDNWEFEPTHKIVLGTNHAPNIKHSSFAIWRRLLLVKFDNRFDGARRDPKLQEKLAAESEGILLWLARGAFMWFQFGLNPPNSVLATTEAYQSEQDTIGRFIKNCCHVLPEGRTPWRAFYKAYEQWCLEGGDWPSTEKYVRTYLLELGCKRKRNNGSWYHGIVLADRANWKQL